MVLPDTALLVFPGVEGFITTAGCRSGDKVAEKWWEIDNWEVYIYSMYFSRGTIVIIVYIVRNN